MADAPTRISWRPIAIGAGAGLAFILIAIFTTIGGPHTLTDSIVNDAYVLILAGFAPVAYLAGAIGLGHLFDPLLRAARDAPALRAALGLALMLWISSVLGSVALSTSPTGRIVAWTPIGIGLVLLLAGWIRRTPQAPPRRWPLVILAICLPASLLLGAALNPPGWLWGSEFAGYDALSYHLQLPQEWLAAGRIIPLEHNVYSYLPSFIESAFAHLAILMGAAPPYAADGTPTGLLTGDGLGAISCQLLHAGLAIISAVLTARAASLAARRAGADEQAAAWCAAPAALLFLATPWVIVTGSLAYNEMGVTLLLPAALLASLDDDLAPWMRAVCAGLLIGVACAVKPTAFFLAGVPLAIVLFGMMPVRAWLPCALAGCAAGLVALAPWLIRNATEAPNPVFPYAASIFGHAHWTGEQLARFTEHHGFDGSLADRLRLIVLEDAHDPAGPRHRGVMHPQWLLFFPISAAASVISVITKRRQRLTWLLTGMLLAQVALWLFTTHIQSRFLLPLAPTGAVLFGVAGALAMTRLGGGRLALIGAMFVLALIQLAGAIYTFTIQQAGQPNRRLLMTPATLAGAGVDPEVAAEFPHMTVNRLLPETAGVYFLADATPFYVTRPVTYNTTWDTWPIGESIRKAPDDPSAWTADLRRRGYDYVLVDLIMLNVFDTSASADPVVTPGAIGAWLDDPSTRIVYDWRRRTGKILVELLPGAAP